MTLSASACRVLFAVQHCAHHDYTSLARAAGVSRSTISSALDELTAAGVITAVRGFKGKGGYRYTVAPAVQSSISPLVQSSNSPIVLALHDADESTHDVEKSSSASTRETNGRMDDWGEFAQKVKRLLSEWLIVGRKADTLTAALVALVRDAGTPSDKVMADLTTIRAGAVKRATVNPAGLTVHIITEYCETGQIALFDVGKTLRGSGNDAPTPERLAASEAAAERYLAKVARRGGLRQVHYTDVSRAAADERARQRIAERARNKVPA